MFLLCSDGFYHTLSQEELDLLGGGQPQENWMRRYLEELGRRCRQRGEQDNLTALGYYYGDISGHYGSLTQAAVKKFQKAKGISPDGIAGTSTLNAIAKALGRPQRTFADQMKRYRTELRKIRGF